MQDDEPNRHRRKIWIVSFAILTLYVLSVGPVVWTAMLLIGDMRHPWQARFAERFEIACELFYAPLTLLAERLLWFERFLAWYVELLS